MLSGLKNLQGLGLFGKTSHGVDADLANRISGGVSSSLSIAFEIFIGVYQYFATNIRCWTPSDFTESMDNYVSEFCLVNKY